MTLPAMPAPWCGCERRREERVRFLPLSKHSMTAQLWSFQRSSDSAHLAVVGVLAGNVELGGDRVARAVEVVLVGEGVNRDTARDGVLVEDDVVGEALVVHPAKSRTIPRSG